MADGRQSFDLVPQGLNRDLAPWDHGAWSNVWNMQFRHPQVERVRGDLEAFPETVNSYPAALSRPLWLHNNIDDAENNWVIPAQDGCAMVDGSTWFNVTGSGWSNSVRDNPFTGGTFNAVTVFNNADVQARSFVNGAAATVALTGSPPVCGAMRPYRNFLVAMDTSSDSDANTDLNAMQVVRWSDAADSTVGTLPSTWAFSASNFAGDAYLPTRTPLIDGFPLRTDFIIYSQSQCFVMSPAGGSVGGDGLAQTVFAFRELFSNIGVLSRNCVAEFEGKHVVLADGDIYIHNGAHAQSIIDQKTRRWLFDEQLGSNYLNSFVALNPAAREVWVCCPFQGSVYAEAALIWDIDTGEWGIRDLSDSLNNFATFARAGSLESGAAGDTWATITPTWAASTRVWDDISTESGTRQMLYCRASDDDTSFQQADGQVDERTATLEKQFFPIGDPTTVKTVKRLWPRVEGADGATLNIRVGSSFQPDGMVSYTSQADFVVGTDSSITLMETGRYFHLFVQNGEQKRWKWSGCRFEFDERGGY